MEILVFSFEQVVTILWRYAGNTAQLQQYDYSAQAIQWATENNIVSSPFEAAKNATRADVAVMLFRYMTLEQNQTTEPIVTEPESTEPESTEPENTTEPAKNISNTLVVYFSATMNAAIWGAELALGDMPERIYCVEPTGTFENDPNLTDKKFPGNPTRSYRSRQPLRIIGEITKWEGHSQSSIQEMKKNLEELKKQGIEAIN